MHRTIFGVVDFISKTKKKGVVEKAQRWNSKFVILS